MCRTFSAILALLLLVGIPSPGARAGDERADPLAARLPRVHGRVISATDGTGVAGVRVLVLHTDMGWTGDAETVSREDGTYELDRAPIGGAFLFAYGPEWISADLVKATFDEPGPLGHRLEPETAYSFDLRVVRAPRLHGHVVDHRGRPVPHATVSATLPPMPGWLHLDEQRHRTTTDSEGRYEFRPLLPGKEYRVLVSATGHPPWRTGLRATDEDETLDIVLPTPQWARIQVVDDEGGPVADAEVEIVLEDDDVLPTQLARLETPADGVLQLGPLPPGAIAVRVEHKDFLSEPVREGYRRIAVLSGDETAPPESTIVLSRGLTIGGRVTDASGAPAVGVDVVASWQGPWHGRAMGGAAKTDDKGNFLIRTLAPGTYELRIPRWTGTFRDFARVRDVEAGRLDVLLELTLQSTPSGPPDAEVSSSEAIQVPVHVTGPDGRPPPQVDVEYVMEQQSGYGPAGHGVRTLELGHPPKGATFFVHVFGAATEGGNPMPLGSVLRGPFQLDVDQIEITLEPEWTIAGQVVDGDGRGVAGVRLAARFPNPYRTGAWLVADSEATSDGDGRFELHRLGPAAYDVEVVEQAGIVSPAPLRFAAGTHDALVRLPRALEPVLHISNWPATLTGWPLAVLIDPSDPERIVARAGVGADGSAAFPAVPPGRYILWVLPQGDLSYLQEEFHPSADPLRVTLREGGRIAGRLQMPEGATCTAIVARSARGLLAFGAALSDGQYEVRGLPLGSWTVSAEGSLDTRHLVGEVCAETGSTADVTLRPASEDR